MTTDKKNILPHIEKKNIIKTIFVMFLTIVKRFKIKIIYDILYNICVNLNYIKNDNHEE